MTAPSLTAAGLPLAAFDALPDEALRDKLWERWGAWRAARSHRSVRAVICDAKTFAAWAKEKGHRLLPADPSAVSLFMEEEAVKGLAVATIDAVSGHSPRVGVCQDALAAGEDLLGVIHAFAWKSPRMPARYAAKLSVRAGAAARLHRKARAQITALTK